MVTFLVPKNKKIRLDQPGCRLRCALPHWLSLGKSYQFFQGKRWVALSMNTVIEDRISTTEFFPLGLSWFEPCDFLMALQSMATAMGAVEGALSQPPAWCLGRNSSCLLSKGPYASVPGHSGKCHQTHFFPQSLTSARPKHVCKLGNNLGSQESLVMKHLGFGTRQCGPWSSTLLFTVLSQGSSFISLGSAFSSAKWK